MRWITTLLIDRIDRWMHAAFFRTTVSFLDRILNAFNKINAKEQKKGQIAFAFVPIDVMRFDSQQPNNLGIYPSGMAKGDLFKTVILDGALPRKTFSMGEAREKRFYVEARKIQ